MSLGPQNALFRLLGLSQSCFQLKCFYETDAEWKEERSWHSSFDRNGRAFQFVGVSFCTGWNP